MTRVAWAIPFLVLAVCAWALRRQLRAAILHARWAWRCRKPPARNEGHPLEESEREALITIRRGYKTAAAERSRT